MHDLLHILCHLCRQEIEEEELAQVLEACDMVSLIFKQRTF